MMCAVYQTVFVPGNRSDEMCVLPDAVAQPGRPATGPAEPTYVLGPAILNEQRSTSFKWGTQGVWGEGTD